MSKILKARDALGDIISVNITTQNVYFNTSDDGAEFTKANAVIFLRRVIKEIEAPEVDPEFVVDERGVDRD